MKLGETLLFGILFLLLGLLLPLTSLAVSELVVPNFPACTSPTGSLKISYDSGIHGIVGDTNTYVGSDQVYIVNDSQLSQCFCSSAGNGIQTDWWKVSSLSQSQIATLEKLGWIFVPSGSAWGLDDSPYMAKNFPYSCLTGGNGGGSNGGTGGGGQAPVCDSKKPAAPSLNSVVRNGSTAILTWSAVSDATHYSISYGLAPGNYIYGVPNTGKVTTYTIGSLDPSKTYYFSVRAVNNCMPSDASGPGGQVLGASTGQVLGLASTGNTTQVLLALGAGVILFGLSLCLKSSSERHS